MDESLWQFALQSFVTFTVVVDPLGVAPRVLGIILAALAVQFVLNGIGGFYESIAGAAENR